MTPRVLRRVASLMTSVKLDKRFSRETAKLHSDCFILQRDWLYLKESLDHFEMVCEEKVILTKTLQERCENEPCYGLKVQADFAVKELAEYGRRRAAVMQDMKAIERQYSKAAARLHRGEDVKLQADFAIKAEQLKTADEECQMMRLDQDASRAVIAHLQGDLLESEDRYFDVGFAVSGLQEAKVVLELENTALREELDLSTQKLQQSVLDRRHLEQLLQQSQQEAEALRQQINILEEDGAAVDEQLEQVEKQIFRAKRANWEAKVAHDFKDEELIKARKQIARLSARLS